MSAMNEIERAVWKYVQSRATLTALVTELNDEVTVAKRGKLPAIKRALAQATERHQALDALIKDNRGEFEKPKTRVLHGVKVGYKKQPGAIEIADEDATLKLIKKMFASDLDMLTQLIKTTEKPSKDALGELSGDKLKKLGVKVTDDTDKVIIKPVDGEVDKIVEALLDGATEEE